MRTTSGPALLATLGELRPVPVGELVVVDRRCSADDPAEPVHVDEAGLPSASLWASVPHYVAAAPNPKAALALVRKLETLIGFTIDATELEDATADYERQISLAVQSDPDVMEFVERLERAAEEQDEEEAAEAASRAMADPMQLPDGDALASQFQRFLRQQDH
ncbi:MAG TPA: PAC2 family protein [Baekduia sp.]|nr:PAC2 family protein [Baekduia sp.]